MHGETVGLAVTPSVALAYAVVAAFLFALSRAPAGAMEPMMSGAEGGAGGVGGWPERAAHWSHFKRAVKGTHVHISGKHMWKYVAEFSYRRNMRHTHAACSICLFRFFHCRA
jgi:hypothetical protein